MGPLNPVVPGGIFRAEDEHGAGDPTQDGLWIIETRLSEEGGGAVGLDLGGLGVKLGGLGRGVQDFNFGFPGFEGLGAGVGV